MHTAKKPIVYISDIVQKNVRKGISSKEEKNNILFLPTESSL
jgi:hypothetical protein